MKRYSLLALLSAGIPSALYAGAWTQPEGRIETINFITVYQASNYFDTTGKKRPQSPYHKQELSTYAEYGLYDDLTVGGQLAVARAYQASASESSSSWNLGDSEFFVRQRLWQNAYSVVSLQPYLLLPTPFTDRIPKIGSNRPAFGIRPAIGFNFEAFGKRHYTDIALSYVHRLGEAGDQLKLDITTGLNINDRWQILPQIFITKSLKSVKNATFTQSPSDNYDLTKIQLSTQYAITNDTRVQLGVFHHLKGKNTGNGHGFILGYVGVF